jgi:hypothetical protein
MQDYSVETTVSNDGSIVIKGLPFRAGDRVEVIVRSRRRQQGGNEAYSLRGKPIRYTDPFEPVVEQAWEVLR